MRPWLGTGDYHDLSEWKQAESASTMLHAANERLQLPPSVEWIRHVIIEAAEGIPDAIAEGQGAEYLAEYILGVDEAISHAVVAGYCFHFLRGEGLIEDSIAEDVEGKLNDLENNLTSLTQSLRESLPAQSRFASN